MSKDTISKGALGRPLLAVRCLIAFALAACTGRPAGVEPVSGFDIIRYQGTWYEIMRLDHSFERGLTNVTATYTLRDDGTVDVLNRGFDRARCRWEEAQGRARFQGRKDVASLSVTFSWPFAGAYHVLELDKENYQFAVVSGPSRDYLWILARSPHMPQDQIEPLVRKVRELGFPVGELIRVDHSDPPCGKLPGANLVEADLHRAYLRANLTGADLPEANLVGTIHSSRRHRRGKRVSRQKHLPSFHPSPFP
jgi:apolipoprotein D and lipocalin family protein